MVPEVARKDGLKGTELASASAAAPTKPLVEHRAALSVEFKLATSLETKLDCVQTSISDHRHD